MFLVILFPLGIFRDFSMSENELSAASKTPSQWNMINIDTRQGVNKCIVFVVKTFTQNTNCAKRDPTRLRSVVIKI